MTVCCFIILLLFKFSKVYWTVDSVVFEKLTSVFFCFVLPDEKLALRRHFCFQMYALAIFR